MSFISPFVKGAIDALQVQGGLKLKGESPFWKGKGDVRPISIVSQLGLASEKFRGVISLSFEEATFLGMLSNMFDEKVDAITDENQDGAAEMLNMVYGAAKVVLNSQGHTFEKAIPTVIRGTNLQTSHGKPKAIVIPLLSQFGYVYIEIAIA